MYLSTTTVDSFREFVNDLPPEQTVLFTSLADYINTWLESGEAPRECVGSFAVYLQTIILIIIQWQRDPHLLDYRRGPAIIVPRQVEVVADTPVHDHDFDWIDREHFAYFNYRAHQRPPCDCD